MGFPGHFALFMDGMGVNLAYRIIENAAAVGVGSRGGDFRGEISGLAEGAGKSTPQDGLRNGHVDAEGAMRQPMGSRDNPIAFDDDDEEGRGIDIDHSS